MSAVLETLFPSFLQRYNMGQMTKICTFLYWLPLVFVMQNRYIGLCWGENAHVHGKDNFPYAEAALRSIQLWHKLTDAKVIMQLVHATEKPSQVLK